MSRFKVELTQSARASIRKIAAYIAGEADAATSGAWLQRVWDAVDSLEEWPERGSIAEESRFTSVEVRRLLVGDYRLLFTVDKPRARVAILDLRSGHRLLRPAPNKPGTADPET